MSNVFEYICVNCGKWSEEDFWECPQCDNENIMEVTIGNDGKVISEIYNKINHINVDEIVCPYCGFANIEEQSLLKFESDISCENCAKRFDYSMTISYTTSK